MRRNLPGFIGFYDIDKKEKNFIRKSWLPIIETKLENPNIFYDGPETYIITFGQNNNFLFPFSSKNIIGVFLGELFDTSKVKNKLWGKKIRDLESPGEILVEAYTEMGPEGIYELEGIFSVVLWDSNKKKILLFRDDSLHRYLYYHFSSSYGITFSTHLDFLFLKQGLHRYIRKESLHEYLRNLEIWPPNTIYRDVFSVEPGLILQYSGNEPQYIKQPKEDLLDTSKMSFEEAAIELDRLLIKSVESRMKGSQRIGFSLSAGTDSTILCAIGAELDKNKVESFTIGNRDRKFDDVGTASTITEHLGVKHHKLYFNMEQYEYAFHKLYSFADQPFCDPATIPTFLGYNYMAELTDFVIDGTGADTLFGMMPPRHKRIATQYASLIPSKIRRFMKNICDFFPLLSEYSPIIDFDEPEDLLSRWKGWTKYEIEKLCQNTVSFAHTKFYQIYSSYPRNAHLERYSAIIRNTSDDRVHESARGTGLLCRFPYWDRNVGRFIHSLDKGFLYKEGEEKRLLRSVLRKHLPKRLSEIPKGYMLFPFDDLMRNKENFLLKRFLDNKNLMEHGLFESSIIKEILNRFIGGDKGVSFRIWALLIFQKWYVSHFD